MPPTILPITNPQEIETRSLSIIDQEVEEPRPFSGHAWEVVRRMIHTTADFDLLHLVRFHPQALEAGLAALGRGATVVTDTEMARMGIPLRRVEPLGVRVRCFMNDPDVAAKAREEGTTRARMAMEQALSCPSAPLLVIGNAPTALLRLMELVDAGAAPPPLVIAMPVGFVNAAESKDMLMQRSDIPYISIKGRKGGSAVAASVVNALAEILLRPGS